ncbi:CarD family transcriptional regulator [Clostridium senegalense]|uniref:CarD family transcriptional regulator n=1 Tax=Clostridium senegalense TaxID=1465809 RepID=UPI001C1103E4|nr:CarD family transcriptional regulator [Clostridium senegalense]MBU5228322.1 transcription factor YdeB [Clostridium senegalense]
MFKIGDKVVYPMQGPGIIENIEEKEFNGEKQQYYIIKILNNNMKLMIPAKKIVDSNLRLLCEPEDLEKTLLKAQNGELDFEENLNSKERYNTNMKKIKSGSFEKGIEVISTLVTANSEKPLNSSEKQLLTNAKKLIIEEIVLSKNISEKEAASFLKSIIS